MFGNVCVAFRESLKIFGKWSEIFARSSKTLSSGCLYHKRNITWYLEDMNFMFSWNKQYLTRYLRSLVRYCSWHSHKNFTSSRHRVISSMSLPFRRPKISMIQSYMTGSCIQQHFLFYIRTFNAMAIGPLSLLWRRIWHFKYGTSRVLWNVQGAYLLPLSRNCLRNNGREFHWPRALKFTREVVG